MENKEKALEGIKQSTNKIAQLEAELASTKEQLNALKSELDKTATVEVAADGAILVEGKKGYFINGDAFVSDMIDYGTNDKDVKYLTTFITKKQARDEVLRREIDCYIRRRACELNDNHDWRKVFERTQYRIINERSESRPNPRFHIDSNFVFFLFCAYFNKEEDAQAVADELNAKYSPEIIKKLYYAE